MPCYSSLPCSIISLLSVFFCCLILSQLASASENVVLPECPSTCGNLTIPYPFGIGTECARKGFDLTCNHSFYPAKTFLSNMSLDPEKVQMFNMSLDPAEVLNISLDPPEARVKRYRAYDCYGNNGSISPNNTLTVWANEDGPYTLSHVRNKFTVLGCDTFGLFSGLAQNAISACSATCDRLEQLVNGSCTGNGCCQLSIPEGIKSYETRLKTFDNYTKVWDFNPCGYAFIVDQEWFTFRSVDITDKSVYRYDVDGVPLVLDWVAGNESCAVASRNRSSFACRSRHSYCYDSNSSSITGYHCKCSSGYEGNPYLDDGCQGC